MIVAHDYQQIVLASTNAFEMDFWDILLQPPSDLPAGSINRAATWSDVKDDFDILWLKTPSPLAGPTLDWDELQLNMSPDEVLIQYQCMLTPLIGGKVNAPKTPPRSHIDTRSTSQQDSGALLAAYKMTWAASYQAALSPTHWHIEPSISTYGFHRSMVANIQEWMPSPLIIWDAQWAILRANGDVEALVPIQQRESKINISLDNLINNLCSGQL